MFEFLITVAVLAVIAFPVIAIIALVRSIELSRLVFGLDARLRALEHALPPGEAPRAPAAAPRAAAPPLPAAAPPARAATCRRAGSGSSSTSPIAAATIAHFGASGAGTGRCRDARARADRF